MGAGGARPQRFAKQNISHSEGIYHTPQAYITSRQRYITSVFGADKYRFVFIQRQYPPKEAGKIPAADKEIIL